MKTCTKCHQSKELSEYYKSNQTKDGYKHHCKTCIRAQVNPQVRERRKYDINNFLSELYKQMKVRCNKRKEYIGKLHISKQEFMEWALEELPIFMSKHNLDPKLGYTNRHISIDKIDDEIGYKKGNLQFLLMPENSKKNGRKNVNKIGQYSPSGELIKIHDCIADANVEMGKARNNACISNVIHGRRPSAYGYIWKIMEEFNNG